MIVIDSWFWIDALMILKSWDLAFPWIGWTVFVASFIERDFLLLKAISKNHNLSVNDSWFWIEALMTRDYTPPRPSEISEKNWSK